MRGRGIGRGLTRAQDSKLVNLPLVSGLGGKLAGGVTFTRASDQWGQDDAGVWQKVPANIPSFNSKGVLLEPASTNKCTCYGVIPEDTLGAELITAQADREFSSDTGFWVEEAGWSIAAGAASAVALTGTNSLYKIMGAYGRIHQLTFTVRDYVAGELEASIGALAGRTYIRVSANGTYTFRGVLAGLSAQIRFQNGNSSFTGSITDISFKEVIPASLGVEMVTGAWTRGTNWGGAGVGTAATLVHTPGSTASAYIWTNPAGGRVSQFTYTISGRTAGSVSIAGVAIGVARSTNGTFTEYLQHPNVPGNLTFLPSSDFDGTISLISQKDCPFAADIPNGVELAVAGDFSSVSGWSGTGWIVSGGTASFSGVAGLLLSNSADPVLTVGKRYRVTFTLLAGGNVAPRIGGDKTGTVRTVPGTYSEVMACDVAGRMGITTTATTTASIDGFSVQEVTPGVKSVHNGTFHIQNHTNMVITGDVASTLEIVEGAADLQAAGLQNICPSLKWYKLTCGGIATAQTWVFITGPVSNLVNYSASVFGKRTSEAVTGKIEIESLGGGTNFTPATGRVTFENQAGATIGSRLIVTGKGGQSIFFCLPMLEELPFCSSPVIPQGAAGVRAATVLQFPVAGNIKDNDFTIFFEGRFNAVAPNTYPQFIIASDGNVGAAQNQVAVQVNTALMNLYTQRMTAGPVYNSTGTKPVVVGTSYKIAVTFSSTTGVRMAVDGVMTTPHANTSSIPFVGNVSLPTGNSTKYIKNLRIYRRPLTDAQIIALTQ